MKNFVIVIIIIHCIFINSFSLSGQYTHQDSLRGMNGPGRFWWNVLRYDLEVTPDYTNKKIVGCNTIRFEAQKIPPSAIMQIDLQDPMSIDSIIWAGNKKLSFSKEGNAYFIRVITGRSSYSNQELKIFFSGIPREADNPPWDGGWIWSKDEKGRPWMTVACQGTGASVWYPCKDHQSDEPDNGASLSITVPDSLVAVGNGKLKRKNRNKDGSTTWKWEVNNPINNYNLIPYIGMYVNWKKYFPGRKGNLECSYWVLDYNAEKAKKQFGLNVNPMLACFENWFGPYPFYDDSYKLVETPHLGMEHQSAIAYGNKFQNGYLGKDLSETGWGKNWDYIVIHESGHEWFGNSITTNDIADMWVHEGFTDYSEVLFVECKYGKKAANEYCQGLRKRIMNDIPVIGIYGVNKEGSGDMYAKGANLIHTLRQVINNDNLFKKIVEGLNKEFYHKTIDSKDIEAYMIRHAGKDLSKIFDQYLRTTQIPRLEYYIQGSNLSYRWVNAVNGFNMPVRIFSAGKEKWITPNEKWQTQKWETGLNKNSFSVDKNFYIIVKKVTK